jgi:hypothetical protein
MISSRTFASAKARRLAPGGFFHYSVALRAPYKSALLRASLESDKSSSKKPKAKPATAKRKAG